MLTTVKHIPLEKEVLPASTESGTTQKSNLSLAGFIQEFGDGLLQAVSQQNPPVFDEAEDAKRIALLHSLKRQPFPAQTRLVQAVCRLLLDINERAAIINAEMGCGKTLMGIATAALCHAEGYARTLILSPPHLVYKWRREILETVPDAMVSVLNGPDTLSKLLALRNHSQQNPVPMPQRPEFFILGRIRLRMGFHWKPAVMVRYDYQRYGSSNDSGKTPCFYKKVAVASCPQCGQVVKDSHNEALEVDKVPTDRKLFCQFCHEPLWTLGWPKKEASSQLSVVQRLCQLPTIGKKTAEKLVSQFDETFLAKLLNDNWHQLINLVDTQGKLVFSDAQAQRLERALTQSDSGFGQSSYQASEFIKRYLPKGFFSLLIVDEAHEYKSLDSAQGQAMAVIASHVKKVLLLTGTLMGGYAEDLFYLLWRILPKAMMTDGFHYRRGSLHRAAFMFMQQHGVLKTVYKSSATENHRTARGQKVKAHTSKAPGFGPQGIARYVLPYTAFLKLTELDQAVLSPYEEELIEVSMTAEMQCYYEKLETNLKEELRTALRRGDHALLGVILNCLLAWPDCCFRPEHVIHPRNKRLLAFIPSVLDETASPKEAMMLDLCRKAKANGQRSLVYTTYTGTRDTAARLKMHCVKIGLKAAVLRSSVATEKREDWIADHVEEGIDVLICNPELVKTGLDLLAFPTLIFMQSGYNVYSLMQASRRSWRIGQQQPVKVHFLGYQMTAQMACLALMAKKMAVCQSTSGTMPETGLDSLNQEDASIDIALAKQLIT